MTALRSTLGSGRYVASEVDIIIGTVATWRGEASPLIFCHGSGANAESAFNKTEQRSMMRQLGQEFAVCTADLGGETFGNDTGITRIGQVKSYLASTWGATGPAVLVSGSMGTLNAMAYTLAHPTDVAAIAAFIPALDIADLLLATDGGAVPPLIHAAYGGTYSDVTHGPTHSPVQFADDLPAIPIALWAADNDTAARPGPVNAFVAARPETDLTWVGNLEHTDAAIGASVSGVVEFVLNL